jgi:signal recognition particle GTPase
LPPGVTNQDLENLLVESNAAVACTESLLKALLSGTLEIPDVKTVQSELKKSINLTLEESKRIEIKQKLGRAAKLLLKKRERIH